MMEPARYYPLFVWLFALALVTARLEIHIEGARGWAADLPTWRYGPPWLRALLNGKELTGYHVYFLLLLLGLFHLPALLLGFSWRLEALIGSLLFPFVVAWDFLWFATNPAFGWSRFSAANVWWFRRWLGPFPLDYYAGAVAGATCAALLSSEHLGRWAIGLCALIGAAALVAALGQLICKAQGRP